MRDKAGITQAVTLCVLVLTATSGLAQDKTDKTTDTSTKLGNTGSESKREEDRAAVEIAPESQPGPRVASSDSIQPSGNPTQANNSNATSPPPPASVQDKWQFVLTPYFWLASQHGSSGVGDQTAQVDKNFKDGIPVLDFFFMGLFEARKDRFVSLTDLEFVAVSGDKATSGPLFSGVNVDFSLVIFDPEVGYRVYANDEKDIYIDVIGGPRIWHLSTDLDFSAGIRPALQAGASRTWVDGVGGLRFKAPISEKMFVYGKFDLGAGGSTSTYQIFGGAGYNVTGKFAFTMGYRVLDVNYNKRSFVYDMSEQGVTIGMVFKF